MLFIFSPSKISAQGRIWYVTLKSSPSLFSFTILIAYSKATVTKHLLVSDYSDLEMCKKNVYLYGFYLPIASLCFLQSPDSGQFYSQELERMPHPVRLTVFRLSRCDESDCVLLHKDNFKWIYVFCDVGAQLPNLDLNFLTWQHINILLYLHYNINSLKNLPISDLKISTNACLFRELIEYAHCFFKSCPFYYLSVSVGYP